MKEQTGKPIQGDVIMLTEYLYGGPEKYMFSFYVVQRYCKDSFGFQTSVATKKITPNGEVGVIIREVFLMSDFDNLGKYTGLPLIDAYPQYFL